MIVSTSFIKKFAWYSIIVAIIHFIGESFFTSIYGQSTIQFSIDILAITLLLIGGYISLKNNKKSGVLCGAWGFTFCLNLRAWALRFEAKENGIINENTTNVHTVLSILLLFCFVSFIISILINLPKTKIE